MKEAKGFPIALFIVEEEELGDKNRAAMVSDGCDRELRLSQSMGKSRAMRAMPRKPGSGGTLAQPE